MANDIFLNMMGQVEGLSDSDLNTIRQRFEPRKIKRKTNLLTAGKIATEVYFILEGCMRLSYEKDGADISAYFFTEGSFAGAYDSFISQRPSRHFIEAIEPCQVVAISYQNLQQSLVDFPPMNGFVRKVMDERFISLHQLYTSLILDSPEERYLNLINTRPDLINRIPQHQIATFLGVTSVSLSRIKKRVAKK